MYQMYAFMYVGANACEPMLVSYLCMCAYLCVHFSYLLVNPTDKRGEGDREPSKSEIKATVF